MGGLSHRPLEPDHEYTVVFDSYDIKKNQVLRDWATANPSLVPPDDAGRPTLPILVEHFCNEMWRTLIDPNGTGYIDEDSINEFFTEADPEDTGHLTIDQLVAALKKVLGNAGSAVVAQQMVAMATTHEPESRRHSKTSET